MARSNRKTAQRSSTTTAARPAEAPVHAARSIKNYTFEYQRDRVSRRAGSSYFRVENNSGGDGIVMTLQEAQSLYNFLGNALNS